MTSTSRTTPASPQTVGARLDALPLSGWHRRMVRLIGLGSFFNFYEVALGSFLGTLLSVQWHLSATEVALTVGAAFLGEMIGSVTLAPLADRFGRRLLFQVNLIAYAVLSLATAFSPNLSVFLVLRVLTGVGLGAELTLVDTYLAELLPAKRRGRYIAYSYTLGLVGVPVAGALSKAATGSVLGVAGWRWLLVLAAAGSLAAWLPTRRMPESPRWLAAVGRGAEADRVLRGIERAAGTPTGPPTLALSPDAPTTRPDPRTYRRRSVLLWAMWICGPIGFYGFASIAPIVLRAKGFDVAHSLTYAALTAIGYPLGSLLSVYLTERVPRRTLLIVSSLSVGAFGLVFGTTNSAGLILAAGTASTLSTVVQSNISHIYQTELFPSSHRSTLIGLPYAASRLLGAVLPLGAVTLLATIGASGLYAICAVILIVLAVTVRLIGPRTDHRPLDAI